MIESTIQQLKKVYIWEIVRISGTERQDKVIGYAASYAKAVVAAETIGTCKVGNRVGAWNHGMGYYSDPVKLNMFTVQTKVFGINEKEEQPLPPFGTPEIKPKDQNDIQVERLDGDRT